MAIERSVTRNSIWNLVGQVAPVPAALLAIPILIARCGADRFGVLTLAWMLVGYFSLFDLGLGRALTQLIAERMGKGNREGLGGLTWAGLGMMSILGLVGGAALLAVSPMLVHSVLKIPRELQNEAQVGFYLLAACVPFAVVTAGLRGILEALHRFDITNAVRVPIGFLTYLAPVGAVVASPTLPALIGSLVVVRVAGCSVHLYFCLRCLPELRQPVALDRTSMKGLLRIGGWMTVSNVISPLMAYFDRFLIGSVVSVTTLAYYTTPFELVSRLALFPSAVSGVLFPTFASLHVVDAAKTERIAVRATKLIGAVLFPFSLAFTVFAPEILRLWVGSTFAREGATAMQWLAVGAFVNCLAYVPFALIQGIGRPRVTAIVHLVELPLYAAALWGLTQWNGIDGAALAWTARVTLDAVALFSLVAFMLPARARIARYAGASFAALGIGVLVALLVDSFVLRCVLAVAITVLYGVVLWRCGLDDEEKTFVRQFGRGQRREAAV